MKVFEESLIPIRNNDDGIIVCRRYTEEMLIQLSKQLENAVQNSKDEQNIEENVIYALQTDGWLWRRANLKFVRADDQVRVLELIDQSGVYDFDEKVKVRKITDASLRDMAFGMIKLFIYGIRKFRRNHHYNLMFNQLIETQMISAIFCLIEPKENKVHECYVGDLFYKYNQKTFSFRELLIHQQRRDPIFLQLDINRVLFEKAVKLIASNNMVYSTLASVIHSPAPILEMKKVQHKINASFGLVSRVGEGGVS